MFEKRYFPEEIFCENCNKSLRIKIISNTFFIKPCEYCMEELKIKTQIEFNNDIINQLKEKMKG